MANKLFSSKENFRQTFEQGLVDLLDQDGIGTFILVLANSSFDKHVHDYTESCILQRYEELSSYYQYALKEGIILSEPEDDVLVFLKLLAISLAKIRATEFRREGNWELQFNHMRSLRPARVSNHDFTGTEIPFDEQAFNFNKPFLQKEAYWNGEFLGKHLSIFYNKFPFARFHSLLVPDKNLQINQLLNYTYHEYIWQFAEKFAESLPGLGLAYNSIGAFSSVNHLHFHFFIKDNPLPIMYKRWSHNGGKIDYPLNCHVFTRIQESWEFIDCLNKKHIPYNLFYLPGKIFCVPRRHQCDVASPDWSSGFAWYEISGGFTTFNHDDFSGLDGDTLFSELKKLKMDCE